MKELEMIKAFAKLEGLSFKVFKDEEVWLIDCDSVQIEGFKYNPLTDYALTFKAMVDYDVKIDGLNASMCNDEGMYMAMNQGYLSVPDSKLVAYAIIEVILKSEGLWK